MTLQKVTSLGFNWQCVVLCCYTKTLWLPVPSKRPWCNWYDTMCARLTQPPAMTGVHNHMSMLPDTVHHPRHKNTYQQ